MRRLGRFWQVSLTGANVCCFIGYLKGKSSLMIYEQFGDLKFQYCNRSFGAIGIMATQWKKYKENSGVYHETDSKDKLGIN